jgi:hypothetical protein
VLLEEQTRKIQKNCKIIIFAKTKFMSEFKQLEGLCSSDTSCLEIYQHVAFMLEAHSFDLLIVSCPGENKYLSILREIAYQIKDALKVRCSPLNIRSGKPPVHRHGVACSSGCGEKLHRMRINNIRRCVIALKPYWEEFLEKSQVEQINEI